MKQSINIVNKKTLFSSYFSFMQFNIEHSVNDQTVQYTREVFARGDAVTVLPFDPSTGSVLLTKQFRVGAHREKDAFLLETIAGIVEEGESREDVASRESLEEAGIVLKNMKMITECYPSPGACDEKVTVYLAEFDSSNYSAGEFGLESENEFIETSLVHINQLKTMIAERKIVNGMTIIAVQALLLNQIGLV